jgi:Holliday junction resolvasome RuvABC ATP-dependent DNA helicase subunit
VAILVNACRGVPRILNNYLKNAGILTPTGGLCDRAGALAVVVDANETTVDGLSADMQAMLRFLYTRCGRQTGDTVTYQASVNTIATAIGLSGDTKEVLLRVEPYLLAEGYVQLTPGGRRLTDLGIARAERLLYEEGN